MRIVEIERSLKHGDKVRIARMTGFTKQYVTLCFKGKRPMHPLIWHAALRIVEAYKKRIEALTSEIN